MKFKITAALAASIIVMFLAAPAEARHYRHHAQVSQSGKPWRFCGWEAARFLGINDPHGYLNLAWNWAVKFRSAAPAPGMAAVRHGHVFILKYHVAGSVWFVHDGNSGHHQTHEHERSINGFRIVDPTSSRLASR